MDFFMDFLKKYKFYGMKKGKIEGLNEYGSFPVIALIKRTGKLAEIEGGGVGSL